MGKGDFVTGRDIKRGLLSRGESGVGEYIEGTSFLYLVENFGPSIKPTGTRITVTTLLSGTMSSVPLATSGNFAQFDSNGQLVDSGKKIADFLQVALNLTDVADRQTALNNLTDSASTTTDFILTRNAGGEAIWQANPVQPQTPWEQDIDGGGFSLTNALINDFTNTVHADDIHLRIRNESGDGLVKGDLVYASGFSIGQNLTLVQKADATSMTTMPAIGMVNETIANNASGMIIESGRVSGVDTSSFSVKDSVYATTTPGEFGVRPTGATEQVQSMGVVLRSHASMGEIEVVGAGRINDVPNLEDGRLWIGDATNLAVPLAISGDITIDNGGVADIASEVVGDAEISSHTSTKITITDKSQLNSSIVYTDQTNTYGAFAQVFPSTQLQINNPANTFQYIVTGSAIVADRAITLPLLTSGDTFVTEAFIQTLTNKTVDADSNTITNIGSSEIVVDVISGQSLVTAVATDMILIEDATDGLLKRVDAGDFIQATITADNGLTKTGDNIQLGGALTGDTTVSGAFNMTFSNTAIGIGAAPTTALVQITPPAYAASGDAETVAITANISAQDTATDPTYCALCIDITESGRDSEGRASLIDGVVNSINVFHVDIRNGSAHVDIGNHGTEDNSIDINGVLYETALRVNDQGAVNEAQFIVHRHSTTLAPVILGARTNDDTTSHTTITTGQGVLSMIGTGYTGSHYDLFASIDMEADTGTISSTSSPGRISFKTTADGAQVPVERLLIQSSLITSSVPYLIQSATVSNLLILDSDAGTGARAILKHGDISRTSGAYRGVLLWNDQNDNTKAQIGFTGSGSTMVIGTETAGDTIELKTANIARLSITDTLITSSVDLQVEGDIDLTSDVSNRILLPVNNVPATPTIAFGDGDSGFYANSDNILAVSLGGNSKWVFNGNVLISQQTGNSVRLGGLSYTWSGDTDTSITRLGANNIAIIAGSVTVLDFTSTLITSSVDLNIVDTADAGFATSKVLTRDSSGDVNTIVASGGGTTNFLRADGIWAAPAEGSNHDLLSVTHDDTTTATVVRGDILVGNATPAWDRLAVGGAGTYLRSDATDSTWTALDISDDATPTLGGNLAGGGFTITGTGTISVTDAGGASILDEASSVTNPTLIPDRAFVSSGIGGDGGTIVSVIIASAEKVSVTATSTIFTGNILVSTTDGGGIQNETASATNPVLIPDRGDTTSGIGGGTTDQFVTIISNSKSGLNVLDTTTAVTGTNVEIGGANAWTGAAYGVTTQGERVLRLNDVSVAPIGAMSAGGGLLWVEDTALNFMDDAGTITDLTAVEKSKSITIESPTNTEDISIFFTNKAITITEMRAVRVGGTTVDWTVRHGTNRNGAGAEAVTGGTTTTSNTTGSDVTSFDDATIVADSFIWIETSGTVDVSELHITIIYTED